MFYLFSSLSFIELNEKCFGSITEDFIFFPSFFNEIFSLPKQKRVSQLINFLFFLITLY